MLTCEKAKEFSFCKTLIFVHDGLNPGGSGHKFDPELQLRLYKGTIRYMAYNRHKSELSHTASLNYYFNKVETECIKVNPRSAIFE